MPNERVEHEHRIQGRLRQLGIDPIEYTQLKMRILAGLVAGEKNGDRRRSMLAAARFAFEDAVLSCSDMFQWKKAAVEAAGRSAEFHRSRSSEPGR